jgi:hypothetical protein
MSIPVQISGRVHYVARWRAALAALTGHATRTRCGLPIRQSSNPPGDPCGRCARRAGERSL